MDELETKQTLQKILQVYDERLILSTLLIWIGMAASIGAAILIFNLGVRYSFFYGLFAFIMAIVVGNIMVEKAKRRAVDSYNEAFPLNSTERDLADRLLTAVDKPKQTANLLRIALGIKNEEETRLAKLALLEETRLAELAKDADSSNHKQPIREIFPITDTFQCGSCDAVISWSKGAQNSVCHKCKVTLLLPPFLSCPSCGDMNIRLMSKPGNTASDAGLLMYGPAGLLAGDGMDPALADLPQDMQQQVKNPVFCCESCQTNWGIKLPVATRELERILSSGDGSFVTELEKTVHLKNMGLITEDEFITAKRKLLE